MNATGRLVAYGAGLVLLFGVGLGAGRLLMPDSAPTGQQHASDSVESGELEGHGHDGDHSSSSAEESSESSRGLSLAQHGYVLGPVTAPRLVGTAGQLSFTITDAEGSPVTDFAVSHEKRLHLIVVRTDGSRFRHVHPRLDDSTGTWSLPWAWDAGGTYRVFADFVPAGATDAPDVTLTRTVDVAGELAPESATAVRRSTTVDGYEVRLSGDLEAGQSTQLQIAVSKDGKPVTTLEPYLGAFGHLVALRDGDLAYLHVHPEGDSPAPGAMGGPTISVEVEAPTAGHYLLYLDFQIDGTVRTATFVLEAGK
ncbi:MAG: heavy-metal-associated domain-containing protein [Microlunatus sp.]